MTHTLHAIRLRGPWEYTFTPHHASRSKESEVQTGRARLPEEASCLCAFQDGALVMVRRFGMPTGVEPRDELWLVIEGLLNDSEVRLGEQTLSATRSTNGTAEFDVSQLLENRNVLFVTRQVSGAPLFAEVRLEIRRS